MMVRMRHTSTFLAIAALTLGLLAGAVPAAADVGAWTPLGPEGGYVRAIAADPNHPDVVFASIAGTVFRTTDGGDSWSYAGVGLGDPTFLGFESLAVNGDVVLVGGRYGEGVWRSADEGLSWRQATADLPSVWALAGDPRRPHRFWMSQWNGLFVSDDGGESWTASNGSGRPSAIEEITVDSSTGQLYAGTATGSFTSTDDGESWSALRCFGKPCGYVAVDPRHAGTLVANSSQGLLRSRDAGSTWEKLRLPRGVRFSQLAFHGSRLLGVSLSYVDGKVVERVYLGEDQGDRWTLAQGQPFGPFLSVLVSAGDTVFLGSSGWSTAGGVLRSRDGGNHWELARTGLSPRWIGSIAVQPLRPELLFAKSENHLLVSANGGSSWRVSLPFPGTFSFGGGDMLVDAGVPGRVFAALLGSLYRSDDDGAHWTRVPRVTDRGSATAVEADRRTAGGAWVGTTVGLYNSRDGRRAWKSVRLSGHEQVAVLDVAAFASDPLLVWAAGHAYGSPDAPRVYRSVDGGQSWQRRDDGLPGSSVTQLALHPARRDTLFAAAGGGIFRSRDGGATWQRLQAPFAVAPDPELARWELVIAPAAPDTVYAYLDRPGHEGVYRSRDQGESWQGIGPAPGEAGGGVHALAVDPQDARHLFIGTGRRGILTWTEP